MKKMKFLLFVVVLATAFSCKRTEEVAPVNPEPPAIQSNDSLVMQDVPGVPVVIAGSLNSIGSVDGTGAAARFHSPMGIFTRSDGFLLVADNQNRAIRRISTANAVTTQYHTDFMPTDVAAIANGAVGVINASMFSFYYHGSHVTVNATDGCPSCAFGGIDKNPGSTLFWLGLNEASSDSWLYSINEMKITPKDNIVLSHYGKGGPYLQITSFSVAANDNKFFTTPTQVWECTHSGTIFSIIANVTNPPHFTNLTSIIANQDGTKLYVADNGTIKKITRGPIFGPTLTTLLSNAGAYGLALSLDGRILYFTSMIHHTVSRVVLP